MKKEDIIEGQIVWSIEIWSGNIVSGVIEQINMELEADEHIIKNKVLKVDIKENEVSVDIFFSIYEDITDYAEIIEEQIPENIINENNWFNKNDYVIIKKIKVVIVWLRQLLKN